MNLARQWYDKRTAEVLGVQFKFGRAEDRMTFALLKAILNARKQRQLMQQALNSDRRGKSTPYEAKSRYCRA